MATLGMERQASLVLWNAEVPRLIYHLALHDEWREAAENGGHYRQSTLGKSLEDEDFIHCSFATQVQAIADLVYRGRRDVVLLSIDPSRLKVAVKVENLDGGNELFPHIYGPLPIDAVVRVDAVPVDANGRLTTAALLGGE
jgi:glutathione S-transferase